MITKDSQIKQARIILQSIADKPEGYWPQKEGSLDLEKFNKMLEVVKMKKQLIEIGIASGKDLIKIGAVAASMVLSFK